jgi:hypothetical protein
MTSFWIGSDFLCNTNKLCGFGSQGNHNLSIFLDEGRDDFRGVKPRIGLNIYFGGKVKGELEPSVAVLLPSRTVMNFFSCSNDRSRMWDEKIGSLRNLA